MSLTSHIADAWSGFWFRTGSQYNLAAARIVIAVHALWILVSRDLPAIAGLPEVFWSEVPISRQWRYLAFHGHVDIERLILFAAHVTPRNRPAMSILRTCSRQSRMQYHSKGRPQHSLN